MRNGYGNNDPLFHGIPSRLFVKNLKLRVVFDQSRSWFRVKKVENFSSLSTMNTKVIPNNRLFFGNIPMDKTRDEIWKALLKEGVPNVVDVICYKSYNENFVNRGYVFVEFLSTVHAERVRSKYKNSLRLFGRKMIIDRSMPVVDPEPEDMKEVKKIFIRNLPVTMSRHEFVKVLSKALPNFSMITKVYKFKNYSFIHFRTRRSAEIAMETLSNKLKEDIEVTWARPSIPESNYMDILEKDVCHKCCQKITEDTEDLLLNTSFSSDENCSDSSRTTPDSSSSGYRSETNIFSSDLLADTVINNHSRHSSLRNEPIWVLNYVENSLKLSLENKTLEDLLNELDINYFDKIDN